MRAKVPKAPTTKTPTMAMTAKPLRTKAKWLMPNSKKWTTTKRTNQRNRSEQDIVAAQVRTIPVPGDLVFGGGVGAIQTPAKLAVGTNGGV